MSTTTTSLRVAFVDFWPSFEPTEFARRFPVFAALDPLELVEDPRAADLVVFSCFPNGQRTSQPRDPHALPGVKGLRLFYSAENVRPDFQSADFALSFCRDLVDARHLRLPNYVGTQLLHGFAPDALSNPPSDPAALRRSKTRFCVYVQGNRVAFREDFVRELSTYKRVDCAGPSLNNTGFVADRKRKYELYRESKFAVTFENEAALGYTSEKLPDALLSGCVPIYWGDPSVELDFDPRCFVHRRDHPSIASLVKRIAALDRDDAAFEAMLGAPRIPAGRVADGMDPATLRAYFERVFAAARARSARFTAAA
jgi:alpha(1,3/1,4) fucosyltransferase